MRIKYNCRFFKGNLPCRYHKEGGAVCAGCLHYSPKSPKILVIKLAAAGDVLRTTCILPALKSKFKDAYIAWLTHSDSRPLLAENEFIDEILDYNLDTLSRLLVEKFDLVFSPSNEREACILATLAKAKKKFGFIYRRRGYIQPLGKMARYYLEMGTNDLRKKQNKLTYQQIIFPMLGLKDDNSKPLLRLTGEELARAEEFRVRYNLGKGPVVGLNTGSGERWPLKKLPVEKTVELAKRLRQELKARIILFGGPQEEERNKEIMQRCPDVLVDAGCRNSLREFAALLNLADILVTSDTLALHIATALNKYVIALFGPTSSAEVELYGLGRKVYPQGLECLACYKNHCLKQPNCMDSIGTDEVILAVKEFRKGKFSP